MNTYSKYTYMLEIIRLKKRHAELLAYRSTLEAQLGNTKARRRFSLAKK